MNALGATDDNSSTEDLEKRILDVIAQEAVIDRDKLAPNATLESLGLNSIDVVHILLGLEDKFGIYIALDDALAGIKNVGELVTYFAKMLGEGKV
jgi:acyl carrier protein